MRIGILKESFCVGGTERSAANASKILCKEHDVCVALYDDRDIKYNYGGELVSFNLPAANSIFAKVSNNFFRILKYKQLIRRKKLDLLYEFISINNPISLLKHKSAARIISARDFSVMENCTERFNKCLKNADAMICNSQYLKKYFTDKYPEQKDKVFAVYNYIDTEEICSQAQEIPDAQFLSFVESHQHYIVSVGRFCKEKGFEYLIEAVAKAREKSVDIGLVLVGDGEYKQKYLDIISRLNLKEHIFFTGFQQNPYKYMARCSCFVLSSLSEGFPNVLAEAMALGLPTVATNCYSGPAEILRKDADYSAVKDKFQECDYGIITPAFNDSDNQNAIDELAKAMAGLLSDSELCEKYKALSLQRALDFSEEVTRNKLNEIFGILQERRKRL